MDDLKTGDLILFCGNISGFMGYFSSMIKCATHSNYSHIGMILKDPSFIHPTLKGTYVWESGWEDFDKDAQDGKVKLGVQITPLAEIIKNFEKSIVIVRKVHCDPALFSDDILRKVHKVVYDKPYDLVPTDWIEALVRKNLTPQRTDRFWCSALVGYIYTQCGVLDPGTDWTILRPSDFSVDGQKLEFSEGCSLDNSETRIK